MLVARSYECTHPIISQVQPSPDQYGDIDREQDVGEEWAADANVSGDGAAR
jgi:hypothetical protein